MNGQGGGGASVVEMFTMCSTNTSGTGVERGPTERKAEWGNVWPARWLSPWLTFSLSSFFKIPNRHLPTFTYINDCNIFSQRCNSCHDYTIS